MRNNEKRWKTVTEDEKSKIYQIIIDTNVMVSALRSSQGASYRLLDLVKDIDDKRFRINVSTALILNTRLC